MLVYTSFLEISYFPHIYQHTDPTFGARDDSRQKIAADDPQHFLEADNASEQAQVDLYDPATARFGASDMHLRCWYGYGQNGAWMQGAMCKNTLPEIKCLSKCRRAGVLSCGLVLDILIGTFLSGTSDKCRHTKIRN